MDISEIFENIHHMDYIYAELLSDMKENYHFVEM